MENNQSNWKKKPKALYKFICIILEFCCHLPGFYFWINLKKIYKIRINWIWHVLLSSLGVSENNTVSTVIHHFCILRIYISFPSTIMVPWSTMRLSNLVNIFRSFMLFPIAWDSGIIVVRRNPLKQSDFKVAAKYTNICLRV